MTFWDILIEYKAILGTVIGSVVTLVVTHLLRSFGKLHWDIKNWTFSLFSTNAIGDIVSTDLFEDAHISNFRFEAVIFNNSETQKSLKDISLEFKSNVTSIRKELQGSESSIYAGEGYFRINNDSKVINISPKQMVNFHFDGSLSEKQFKQLGRDFNINLLATDYRNKVYKIPIASVHLEP